MNLLRGKLRNEKGLTLIEMLIAILIFILATVFIVSLVSNALDKPKDAGIKGTLDYYETGASLLLHETANATDKDTLLAELNNDLDEASKFKSGKSGLVNAYNNPYKAKVVQTGSQTAIVVETQGKKVDEFYKMVVIKDKGTVESCTVGFGRNDKGLVTLVSGLCGDQQVIGDVDGEPILGLSKGALIKFGGMDWTLLDPATGYIHLNVGQELGAMVMFDRYNANKFNPGDINNIGYYLNTTWWATVPPVEQGLVEESNWGIGWLNDAEGGWGNQKPALELDAMRNKENGVTVKAKVGLLSVSEYREYSKYYGGSGGVIEYIGSKTTWLRTPYTGNDVSVWTVQSTGEMKHNYGGGESYSMSIRPALNIDIGTLVSPDGTLLP